MKPSILLLSLSLLGFGIANAGTNPCHNPVKGRKEEVVGMIQHADNKKPLNKVNITAYLLSQKQKTVVSDENGTYSFDDLKPGTYRLTFEKAGFKKITRDKVVIKTDEACQVNVEMEETRLVDFGPNALHFSDF